MSMCTWPSIVTMNQLPTGWYRTKNIKIPHRKVYSWKTCIQFFLYNVHNTAKPVKCQYTLLHNFQGNKIWNAISPKTPWIIMKDASSSPDTSITRAHPSSPPLKALTMNQLPTGWYGTKNLNIPHRKIPGNWKMPWQNFKMQDIFKNFPSPPPPPPQPHTHTHTVL